MCSFDALGPLLLERLQAEDWAGVECLTDFQLQVEHALDLEGRGLVLVMDPPYYDNVMYAELSDFFYVWLKRTAGYVYPELFRRNLTDKEHEAVANPAKLNGQKGAKALATCDYQERMAAIFAECRRR